MTVTILFKNLLITLLLSLLLLLLCDTIVVMSRRALRLRTISPSTTSQSQLSATPSFHFIPELVSERGRMRVREFSELYRVVNRVLRRED